MRPKHRENRKYQPRMRRINTHRLICQEFQEMNDYSTISEIQQASNRLSFSSILCWDEGQLRINPLDKFPFLRIFGVHGLKKNNTHLRSVIKREKYQEYIRPLCVFLLPAGVVSSPPLQ